MTLPEFRKLPFGDKADIIKHKAVYLAHRAIGPCNDKMHVFLYSHDDFFIQAFFSDIREKVLFINSFKHINMLEPYMETISIYELTKVI